jgi:CubicO group peptidase (beta-lactamase class C family)
VGQLLAQTTGLRAEPPGPWWERVDGPEWIDLAAAVAAADLLQPAGRRFHYSNLGYALLGRLVEVLRGASWGACLDREILRPLGMDATTVGAPQVHAPGLAVHPWADLVLSEPAPDYRAMAPAGALWSTIADLAVWARFLLGETGEVLDPGTLDEMLEPGGADADVTGASAYGLGVQVHQVDGRTLVGHGGSVPGHVAGVLVDRAERTAAMAVANATQGDLGELLPRLLAIVREREPLVVDEWRPTAGATAAPPLDVTGVWYWGATPIAVRAVGNGGLHLEALGGRGRTSRFAPTGKDLWRGRDGYYAGEELRALRDTDGGITHLDVATFVLTRAPYEGDAVPGGAAGGAWRDAPGDAG